MSTPTPPIPPGQTPQPPDWEAVARWLETGEGGGEPEVRRWMAEHPKDAELISALGRHLEPLGDVETRPVDVEAALAKVRAGIANPVAGRISPATERPRFAARTQPKAVPMGWRIAAGFAIIALGALTWRLNRPEPVVQLAAQTYETGVAQRSVITLPDSSTAVLAPGSRIVVAADYGATSRSIELHGEGYFDVKHDDAKPFVIRTNGAVIRDLGTTFSVRALPNEPVRVAVTSGVVWLQSPTDSAGGVLLEKGDAGTVTTAGVASAQQGVVTEDDVAWKDGRHPFNDTPMTQVAAEIRRWYGVELVLQDSSVRNRRLNATLVGESVDSALSIISQAIGASVTKTGKGDTVILRRQR
jgi:transmembrane sensor